ncbi:MAG: NAD(P)-dependent oxidoreductase [Betaproteobacteria bacterium]|nr:NAD(P)-dependent oxidoreductase [Betaproteobacteria bacterium]
MTLDKILVTGASGCLGYPLANQLAREGRSVVGVDIVPARGPVSFHSVSGDVCDPHLIYGLFHAYRFDAVVHCGGISGQMVAPGEPYRNCQVNVFGTVHLLEAARRHEIAHFVYCSSQAAYGDAPVQPLLENTPFQPTTVYGATKAACDLLARGYRVQHGLNTTALRIGRVYGPGRRTGSLIFSMLDAAVSKRPLCLPASGGRRLQYVYDADIVSALYLALNAGKLPNPAYNVSGPGSHSDEEIAALIRSLAPEADITFEHSNAKGETAVGAPLDYSAAQRDFGYEPRYDLARGIAAYLEWLRNK